MTCCEGEDGCVERCRVDGCWTPEPCVEAGGKVDMAGKEDSGKDSEPGTVVVEGTRLRLLHNIRKLHVRCKGRQKEDSQLTFDKLLQVRWQLCRLHPRKGCVDRLPQRAP